MFWKLSHFIYFQPVIWLYLQNVSKLCNQKATSLSFDLRYSLLIFSILFQVREMIVQQQKQNQNTNSSTNSNQGNANQQKLVYHTSSSSEQLSSPSYRPSAFPGLSNINPSTGEVSQPNSERRSEAPVAKVAERVKLKPSRSDSSKSSGERPVYGSELSNSVSQLHFTSTLL